MILQTLVNNQSKFENVQGLNQIIGLTLNNISCCLKKKGNISEAEKLLKNALKYQKIANEDTDFLENEDFDININNLQIKNNSDNPVYIYDMEKQSTNDQIRQLTAIQTNKNLSLKDESALTELNLCAVFSQKGQFKEAILHASNSITKLQNDIQLFKQKYLKLVVEQQVQKQEKLKIKIKEKQSLLAIAFFNKGCQHEHLKQKNLALQSYIKSLQVEREKLELTIDQEITEKHYLISPLLREFKRSHDDLLSQIQRENMIKREQQEALTFTGLTKKKVDMITSSKTSSFRGSVYNFQPSQIRPSSSQYYGNKLVQNQVLSNQINTITTQTNFFNEKQSQLEYAYNEDAFGDLPKILYSVPKKKRPMSAKNPMLDKRKFQKVEQQICSNQSLKEQQNDQQNQFNEQSKQNSNKFIIIESQNQLNQQKLKDEKLIDNYQNKVIKQKRARPSSSSFFNQKSKQESLSNMMVLGGKCNPVVDIGNYVSLDSISAVGISTVKHRKFTQFDSDSQKPSFAIRQDQKITQSSKCMESRQNLDILSDKTVQVSKDNLNVLNYDYNLLTQPQLSIRPKIIQSVKVLKSNKNQNIIKANQNHWKSNLKISNSSYKLQKPNAFFNQQIDEGDFIQMGIKDIKKSDNKKELEQIKERLKLNYDSQIIKKKPESQDINFLEKIDELYKKIFNQQKDKLQVGNQPIQDFPANIYMQEYQKQKSIKIDNQRLLRDYQKIQTVIPSFSYAQQIPQKNKSSNRQRPFTAKVQQITSPASKYSTQQNADQNDHCQTFTKLKEPIINNFKSKNALDLHQRPKSRLIAKNSQIQKLKNQIQKDQNWQKIDQIFISSKMMSQNLSPSKNSGMNQDIEGQSSLLNIKVRNSIQLLQDEILSDKRPSNQNSFRKLPEQEDQAMCIENNQTSINKQIALEEKIQSRNESAIEIKNSMFSIKEEEVNSLEYTHLNELTYNQPPQSNDLNLINHQGPS